MATVVNTYARAFADVVIGSRLDAARTLAEAQQIAALAEQSRELREVWDNGSRACRTGIRPVTRHRQNDSREV